MTCHIFWHMDGVVKTCHMDDYGHADSHAYNMVARREADPVYMVDIEDNEWTVYRKAGGYVRCRRAEVPQDEVPKPYQLLVMLEG